jgi:hypothetical protein
MRRSRFVTPLAALLLFAAVSPALAGPPLLCHPFDIGEARSLPWGGSWSEGAREYQLGKLVADTETILTPAAPVIVRMETLRRAAPYASLDANVAAQLLGTINARAAAAERAGGSSPATAMALFDAGYLRETYRQIAQLGRDNGFVRRSSAIAGVLGNGEGNTLMNRTVSLRPDDGAIRFAAALVAAGTDRSRYAEHAAKAREGASRDPLLARNIKQLS